MARRLDPSDLEKVACSGDVEKVKKLLDTSSTNLSENQDNPTVKPHVRNEDVQTAFLLAIDRNHVGAIQTLVLAGADINSQGTGLSFNMPPLMYALYLNRVSCVGELLKLGADMNSMDNEGRNALMLAAMYERDQCLKLLINAGANVNFQNKEIHFDEDYIGRTVLMYAAEYHKVNLLKMLLEAGADVNVKTSQGLTALHWAVKCYTACDTVSTCIRILLDHGADCNAETSDGETALMVMVRNHKPAHECVKLLIESGTDVNKGNLRGNTVLMIAVRDDDLVTLLPILVKAGAVIDQQDSDGVTALAHAVKYRSCECVRWLLDSGADVTKVDNEGKTVLMHAAKSNFGVHHLPVVGKFGAAFHQQDSKGKIAQEDTIKHKLKLCVGWFIDSGADVTKTDIKGRNVLMYAAEKSYMGHLLPIFVKPGAAIDQQDSRGMTALSHAASTGSHECVRWLLGAGASVNICDNSGMSPLAHASKYGSHQCVRLLVDSGADVNIRDHLR